jgi:hypothetical protein
MSACNKQREIPFFLFEFQLVFIIQNPVYGSLQLWMEITQYRLSLSVLYSTHDAAPPTTSHPSPSNHNMLDHNPTSPLTDTHQEEHQEEEEDSVPQLTLRALVSSKEAGIVIGKAGKNVRDLREETECKAGVSKLVHGVTDRILSISGVVDRVAKAFALVATHLLENPTGAPPSNAQMQHQAGGDAAAAADGEQSGATIKLLIDTHLMGISRA